MELVPHREELIKVLTNLYGYESETLPKCVYVLELESRISGVLASFFGDLRQTCSVIVDATECYSSKVLLDLVLSGLIENHSQYNKLDDLKEFLEEMSGLYLKDPAQRYVIVIENAEKLRELDFNILPVFAKLPEYTGLNISCIMISSIPIEKIHPKIALSDVVKIQIPHLSKTDLIDIFQSEFSQFKAKYKETIMKTCEVSKKAEVSKIIETLDEKFFANYLNIFFSMFYKVCRDPKELKFICKKCFHLYCAPVVSKEIRKEDSNSLWKHIAGPMQNSLHQIYSRVDVQAKETESQITTDFVEDKLHSKYSQIIELPYYAKYLLIASFLASHNDAKSDKRLFMKYHGKQRKRMQDVKKQAKLSEKMGIQTGPKSFTMDRLLAIFYAILDEKVGLTCNLLTQISTLIELNLITFLSGETNILDGNARLQCTVGMEFIVNIGFNVGFNVKKYLVDFH